MLLAGVLGARAAETARVASIINNESVNESANESANHFVHARSESWPAGWSINFAHEHSYHYQLLVRSTFWFDQLFGSRSPRPSPKIQLFGDSAASLLAFCSLIFRSLISVVREARHGKLGTDMGAGQA
jgi:hypothetical protein